MAGHQQKRCLYEVLGVNRDSSQEEIRSSYRRLALQLHPDKLAQSGAAAGADSTAAFQELLHAYEVLSDPKERSWYDSHRSQILFSDPSSASKSRTSSLGVDLFSFFSSSVYSGYTDSGKGFFKVYGDVFSKIYAHELHFAEKLGFPSDDVAPAPLIGNLDSPYSQVTAFYSYWLGYSTVMDFTWVDEYDSFAGPNRKARRLMEEENKKARKKAKREHNDTVRGLAAFVKKRDKRVLDMQMKKKKEEEKRLADEKERKKEEERRRKEKAVMYQESEWAKNDEENEIIWDEDDDDKRKKKGEVELYCVACNKKFKSDKQWKNHEQSKKHREKVAELRSTFDEEEYALKDIAQEELCTSFDYEPHIEDNVSSDSNNPDQLSESFRDDFKLEEEGDVPHVEDNESSDNPDQLSESFRDDLKLEEDGDDNGNENADGLPSNAEVAGPDDDNGIEKDVEYHDLKSHRNRRNRRAKKGTVREPEARDASGEMSGSQKNDNGVHENVEGHFEEISYTVEEISENSKGDQADRSQKIKKQQLDEKGHTKKDTVQQKGSSKGKKQKGAAKAHTNSCGTCGESFDSRAYDDNIFEADGWEIVWRRPHL